jgi:hypothetical protein
MQIEEFRPESYFTGYGLKGHATSWKAAGSGEVIFFLIYPILLASLDPWVYSASSRNEYQKQKNNVSGE